MSQKSGIKLIWLIFLTSKIYISLDTQNMIKIDQNNNLKDDTKLEESNLDSKVIKQDQEVKKAELNFELNQLYSFSETETIFTLEKDYDEQNFFVLKLNGISKLKITLKQKKLIKEVIQLNCQNSCYLPINKENFQFTKNNQIILQIVDKEKLIQFSLSFVPSIIVDFNDNLKILSPFAVQVSFTVKNPHQFVKAQKENRIQMIMTTSLNNQVLSGTEYVDMLINLGKDIPSQNLFDMKASGATGFGLIKTISSLNKNYCIKKECVYSVLIQCVGIQNFYFYPTIVQNDSEFSFKSSLQLIEELEPAEIVTYKLKMPQWNGNWIFSLIPTEGNPQFYINPDQKPLNLTQYRYNGVAEGVELILITNFESKKFNFTFTEFHIAFHNSIEGQGSTFKFLGQKLAQDEQYFIKENQVVNGVIADSEIINFYVQSFPDPMEIATLEVSLNSQNGAADLYVKECIQSDEKCKIQVQDFEKIPKNRIFRFSNNDVKNKEKNDRILIRFKCTPSHLKKPNNNELISNTCIFAIGIYGRFSTKKKGTIYKLLTSGQGLHKKLDLQSSYLVNIAKKEKLFYSYSLVDSKQSNISFKVISITGSCRLFFSKSNSYANESDFDEQIMIISSKLHSLHTQEYIGYIKVDKKTNKQIYLAVYGDEYCVFDIYATDFKDNQINNPEIISLGKQINRHLVESQKIEINETKQKIYYQNFLLKINDQFSNFLKDIYMVINTRRSGFSICVQFGTLFDFNRECDLKSDKEILQIHRENFFIKGELFIISIQLSLEETKNLIFPIEFELTPNPGMPKHTIDFINPGKIFTSNVCSESRASLKLDLSEMKLHALIVLTSEDPMITAQITTNSDENNMEIISQLSLIDFAVLIHRTDAILERISKQGKPELFISVTGSSSTNSRYSISFTIDFIPLLLKEGVQVFYPSNFPALFVYESSLTDPVGFNLISEHTSSIVYAKIFSNLNFNRKDGNILKGLNENLFDFKTSVDVKANVVIPVETIQTKGHIAGFYVIPKLDFIPPKHEINTFTARDLGRVTAHNGIQKLEGFYQISSEVEKGDFTYFYVQIDKPQDFSIVLTLNSGKSELYLNPGHFNLTTTKRYFIKKSSSSGCEIIVDKQSYEKWINPPESFTIGVYGIENTRFELLFLPEFKNFIKVRYQQLIDMELVKDKNYYFDFFNENDKYSSLMYSENSDIEISALNYKESFRNNLINEITNEENYVQKFIFKNEDIPRKQFVNTTQTDSHVVIRIKAIDNNARFLFMIYDQLKPIIIPSENRFNFLQNKDDIVVFKVFLNSAYEEVDVDIKLNFGQIELGISNSNGNFTIELISSVSQKYFQFRIENNKQNQIVLFKTIFLRVKAFEYSKFSIFTKPKDKFKRLKPHESEIVYSDPGKDQYLYYFISEDQKNHIFSMVFDVYTPSFMTEKPDLLFIASEDVILTEDSPFLPMQLIDLKEKDAVEFRHFDIKPLISSGYFILKIQRRNNKVPIKISLSLNHHKNIEANGIYQGDIPLTSQSSHKYSVYLPQAGEFRMILESCSEVKIEKAIFTHSHSQEIHFEDSFIQGFQYYAQNYTLLKPITQIYSLYYPVRRGVVEQSGVLKFNVTTSSRNVNLNPKQHYYLMTEFKPVNKELTFNFYVEIEKEFNKTKSFFTADFINNNENLIVKANYPTFRTQLIFDYPNLKRVLVRFYFYVFNDQLFQQKLKICGLAALQEIETERVVVTITIEARDINKLIDQAQVIFSKNTLEKFKNSDFVNIFCYLSISFFEDDLDNYGISLDHKFTNVPYFFLTINNHYNSIIGPKMAYLLVIIISLLFFIAIYFVICKKPQIAVNPFEYAETNKIQPGKLEMTDIKI